MRAMSIVMAANMTSMGNGPSPWPTHIFTSPAIWAAGSSYALSTIALYHMASSQIVNRVVPESTFGKSIVEFNTHLKTWNEAAPISNPNPEAIKQWCSDIANAHLKIIPVMVSHLQNSVLVLSLRSIPTLVAGLLTWPLRKITSWMVIQTPKEVNLLSQSPLRIAKEIYAESGLLGFYSGVPEWLLQLSLQLSLNVLAGRILVYALDIAGNSASMYCLYRTETTEGLLPTLNSPQAVMNHMRFEAMTVLPWKNLLANCAAYICISMASRFIAFPLALISTIRCIQGSPNIGPDSVVATFGRGMSTFDCFASLLLQPLRTACFAWIGFRIKWYLFTMVTVPLGLTLTHQIEEQ